MDKRSYLISGAEHIIFDFGGVLMMHDREGCLQAFRQMMAETDITNVLGVDNDLPSTLRAQFEIGEMSAEEFVLNVQKFCRPRTTERQVIEAWNKIHAGIADSTWVEIKRLKDQGYHIYLFSNTDAIHWQHTLALYRDKIDLYFNRVFLSYEMGLCKPDKNVYEYVNREIGATLKRTCFVDDNETNRLAAEKHVGWETYKSIEELTKNKYNG